MSNNNTVTIRQANYEDHKKLVEWSTSEYDWPLCPDDFLVWQRYIPRDSFFATDDKDGNLNGFIAALKYNEANAGQISMFYVRKDCRGQGIGEKLFERAMDHLNGMNIFLCSVSTMMDKYRDRSGFKFTYDWNALEAGGKPSKFKSFVDSIASAADNITVIRANREVLQNVLTYDKQVSGIDRQQWCENWLLSHPVGVSVVAFENGFAVGYGTVRLIRTVDLSLQPIYANSEHVARKIIIRLLSFFPNVEDREIRFIYRSTDDRMKRIVNDLGLITACSLTFMFTKRTEDNSDFSKAFCLSGTEANLVV